MLCPRCLEEVDVLVSYNNGTVCELCAEELDNGEMEKRYFHELELEQLQDEYLKEDD